MKLLLTILFFSALTANGQIKKSKLDSLDNVFKVIGNALDTTKKNVAIGSRAKSVSKQKGKTVITPNQSLEVSPQVFVLAPGISVRVKNTEKIIYKR